MTFPYAIYLLAGLGAMATSLASLPLWRMFCRRVGLVDDPGQRKIHHVPIPLAGGLAVLTGIIVPLLVGVVLLQCNLLPASFTERSLTNVKAAEHSTSTTEGWRGKPIKVEGESKGFSPAALLQHGFRQRAVQLLGLFLGALGMTLLGCLDDKYELRPSRKFAGQLLLAFLTAAVGVRITLFVDNLLFSYAVTILWILTVTNALNFMDNMNGLCAGLGIVATWCLGLAAMSQGHYLVASICFLVCGALLGFLPYNYPRATAFLGDAGSHLVGYLLAVLAILPHFYSSEHPQAWAVLSPLLLLAVPLFDLAWVVVLRWRLGKPFYIGDTNHLSHRLVRSGRSPALAVALIWLGAAVLGGAVVLWM